LPTSTISDSGGILICPWQDKVIVARNLVATRIDMTCNPVRLSYGRVLDNVIAGLKETTITATCLGDVEIASGGPRMLRDATVLELMEEVNKRLRKRRK